MELVWMIALFILCLFSVSLLTADFFPPWVYLFFACVHNNISQSIEDGRVGWGFLYFMKPESVQPCLWHLSLVTLIRFCVQQDRGSRQA